MKLAFVPPRFGPGVLGGSEAVSREAAFGFAGRGYDVEIVTTCALDHYSWENELPEGVSEEDGLVVRRFPVLAPPQPGGVEGTALGAVREDPRSGPPGELVGLPVRVAADVRVPAASWPALRRGRLFALPFWSTSVCLPFLAERAVVIPCLHDEPYARLDVLRPVLACPELVWFLSGPSTISATALVRWLGGTALRARACLFLRVTTLPDLWKGINWPVHLCSTPAGGKRARGPRGCSKRSPLPSVEGGLDLDLVCIGKGEPGGRHDLPRGSEGRVIDLGFVGDEERNNAFAAATAYVQPSRMESFSRTIMEAWLAGTPVIGSERSDVVTWHCRRSGGGLLFSDGAELAERLNLVARKPDLASELAEAGRRYVIENYTWEPVLDRMEASLARPSDDFWHEPSHDLRDGSSAPVPGVPEPDRTTLSRRCQVSPSRVAPALWPAATRRSRAWRRRRRSQQSGVSGPAAAKS